MKLRGDLQVCHGCCSGISIFLELVRLGVHLSNQHKKVSDDVCVIDAAYHCEDAEHHSFNDSCWTDIVDGEESRAVVNNCRIGEEGVVQIIDLGGAKVDIARGPPSLVDSTDIPYSAR